MRQQHEQNLRPHNATRADLADLRKRFGGLEQRVGSLEHRVDTGFAKMRGRLDGVAAGVRRIADLLTEPTAGRSTRGVARAVGYRESRRGWHG